MFGLFKAKFCFVLHNEIAPTLENKTPVTGGKTRGEQVVFNRLSKGGKSSSWQKFRRSVQFHLKKKKKTTR